MSAPSMPPDNSMQVEQMREQEAERQQQAADAKAAQDKADLAALRTSSAASGTTSAKNYFTQQGLDPEQFAGDIDQQIQDILTGISPTDPNPGAAFLNVGPRIFDAETSANQAKDLSKVNSIFGPNYGETKAPFTLADPFEDAIFAGQRSDADKIIQNMLSRGVITPAGQASAESELDRQAPGVRAQLKGVGQGAIASEQQALNDIANKGRQTAQTIRLGDQFDPFSFGNQADANFSDFINNLDQTIRGKIGSANLFNTTGLAAIAGAGQGAQNLPFDPTAQAGLADDTDQTKNNPSTASPAVF